MKYNKKEVYVHLYYFHTATGIISFSLICYVFVIEIHSIYICVYSLVFPNWTEVYILQKKILKKIRKNLKLGSKSNIKRTYISSLLYLKISTTITSM